MTPVPDSIVIIIIIIIIIIKLHKTIRSRTIDFRMDKCCLPYIAPYGRLEEGNGAKGRPRKRWLDNVTEDCQVTPWLGYCGSYTSSCGQTILEMVHTAVTACLGIALTTRSIYTVSPRHDRETLLLFQRISVMIQRFNATSHTSCTIDAGAISQIH